MYYFHYEDGTTILDNRGLDLLDMKAARAEAVATVAAVLRDGSVGHLWGGKPWRLWVTDQPNGAGHTLFALQIMASGAA